MREIVTLEFARHRRRIAADRQDGWTCICGGWKGFKQAEFNKHLIDSLADAVAEHLPEQVDRWSPAHYRPDVSKERLAGFEDAADRLRKILNGCTCRPGMVGHWGCPVDDGGYE